jgi:hypothetical protein
MSQDAILGTLLLHANALAPTNQPYFAGRVFGHGRPIKSTRPARVLTTFKFVDKLEGDLVVNAHQTSYAGFVEAEGSEVEGSFGAAGDRAITIEGGDALEGDLLGHAVYGEIAGNLYAGLACEGDHLWQAVNFRVLRRCMRANRWSI